MSVPHWLDLPPLPDPPPPDPPVLAAFPFTADELESAWIDWSGYSPVLADVMLVLGRTGLRWNEARVLTVADACAESFTVWGARRVRVVPVARRVRPIVERLLAGRDGAERLFTTSLGEPLRRTAVLARLNWPVTGRGRSLVDLRHTAAQLWLADGVDAAVVRAWMG